MSKCLKCGYVDMRASGVGSIAMSDLCRLEKRSTLLNNAMALLDHAIELGYLGDGSTGGWAKDLLDEFEKVGGAVAAPPEGGKDERLEGKEL